MMNEDRTVASSFGEKDECKTPKKQLPETCERIVAFLDIMGFKDMVARHFNDIKEKLEALSKFIGTTMDEDYQYMIFSDSIILYAKSGDLNVFRSLLQKVSGIIEKSIELGLPIKGAIAKGVCTVSMGYKPFLFGQPIIDAYTLEEDVVLYGVVFHNTVEKQAEDLASIDNDYVFDYNVPLKGGKSSHFVLNWFGSDIGKNIEKLKAIRYTVSDLPRRYIDNTLQCFRAISGESLA